MEQMTNPLPSLKQLVPFALWIFIAPILVHSKGSPKFEMSQRSKECEEKTYGEAPFAYTSSDPQLSTCCTNDSLISFMDTTSVYKLSTRSNGKPMKAKDEACCYPIGSKCTKRRLPCCESGICDKLDDSSVDGSKKKKTKPKYYCKRSYGSAVFDISISKENCLDKSRSVHVLIKKTSQNLGEIPITGHACCKKRAVHVIPFEKNCCSTFNAPCTDTKFPCCGRRKSLYLPSTCNRKTHIPDFTVTRYRYNSTNNVYANGVCDYGVTGYWDITPKLDEEKISISSSPLPFSCTAPSRIKGYFCDIGICCANGSIPFLGIESQKKYCCVFQWMTQDFPCCIGKLDNNYCFKDGQQITLPIDKCKR